MRKTSASRVYDKLDHDLVKTQAALGHKNINSTVSYLSFRQGSDELIGTLENVRLQNGDRVVVSLGSGECEAEIIDASDQAKIKIRLDSGCELWVGRRAVVDLVNEV